MVNAKETTSIVLSRLSNITKWFHEKSIDFGDSEKAETEALVFRQITKCRNGGPRYRRTFNKTRCDDGVARPTGPRVRPLPPDSR